MFPQGYVLLNNASIPFWATIDRTRPYSCHTLTLNIASSDELAVRVVQHNPSRRLCQPKQVSISFSPHRTSSHCPADYSDYWPSNSSPNSSSSSSGSGNSTNLGAIVGGTVGGVALLLLLVGGYFLYKRRQRRRLDRTHGGTPILHAGTPMTNTHTRWPSDPSTVFLPTLAGSPHLSAHSRGMGPGMSVLSPTSYSAFQAAPPLPPTETSSFLTAGNTVVQRTRAIPMV
jgi:hypothetical protein